MPRYYLLLVPGMYTRVLYDWVQEARGYLGRLQVHRRLGRSTEPRIQEPTNI